MDIIQTDNLSKDQKKQVRLLWNNEYPKAIALETAKDFDDYLEKITNKRHLLLISEETEVKGWLCDFDRDNEHWFAMILARDIHGKGYGKNLMRHAQELNEVLNGWVIQTNTMKKADGSYYKSPVDFYKKCGFQVHPENTFETALMKTIKISWNCSMSL